MNYRVDQKLSVQKLRATLVILMKWILTAAHNYWSVHNAKFLYGHCEWPQRRVGKKSLIGHWFIMIFLHYKCLCVLIKPYKLAQYCYDDFFCIKCSKSLFFYQLSAIQNTWCLNCHITTRKREHQQLILTFLY